MILPKTKQQQQQTLFWLVNFIKLQPREVAPHLRMKTRSVLSSRAWT